jgi:hypothetical protein
MAGTDQGSPTVFAGQRHTSETVRLTPAERPCPVGIHRANQVHKSDTVCGRPDTASTPARTPLTVHLTFTSTSFEAAPARPVWGGVADRRANDRLPNAFPTQQEASAVKRIRDVVGRTALVTAVLAIGLSGCSELSPSIVTEPYPASDGTNAELPGSTVALRNFLVIGAEKGKPAELIGAVVNDSAEAVDVAFQTDPGGGAQPAQAVVKVEPYSTVQIGPEQKNTLSIPQLSVEPGATTSLSAATTAGGRTEITVPVLRPEDEYASITPGPTPSDKKKTPKSSASASDDDTPNASETEQPEVAPDPDPTEAN